MREYECRHTIINAFTNALEILLIENRISINQLPPDFHAFFSDRNQSCSTRQAVFTSLKKVTKKDLFALTVVPIIHKMVTTYLTTNEKEVGAIVPFYLSQSVVGIEELKILIALKQLFSIGLEIIYNDVNLCTVNDKSSELKISLHKTSLGWHSQQSSKVEEKNEDQQPPIKQQLTSTQTNYQAKLKDAQCLSAMLETIVDYLRHKNIEKTLYKIATLCGGNGGLSYNDTDDKETYFIRNRYGKRKRNQDNTENKDQSTRIDFEILFRIKSLKDHGIAITVNDVEENLKILARKLKRIIWLEDKEDFSLNFQPIFHLVGEKEPEGDTSDLIDLENFVLENYPLLLLKRCKEESAKLAQITSLTKENIYTLAQKFIVIGELFQELDRISSIENKQKKANLYSLLNFFNIFRNSFLYSHVHRTLLELSKGNRSEQLMATVTQVITNLNLTLNRVNSLHQEVREEEIPALKACEEGFAELLQLVDSATAPDQVKHTQRIHEEITYLIDMANSDHPSRDAIIEHVGMLVEQHARDVEDESQKGKPSLKQPFDNLNRTTLTRKTSTLYERLGDAHQQVANHNAAISYYLAEVNAHYLKALPTQPDITYNKILFNVSSHELQVLAKLQGCYLSKGNLQAVLDIFQLIFSRFSYATVLRYRKMIARHKSDLTAARRDFPDIVTLIETSLNSLKCRNISYVLEFDEVVFFESLADILTNAAKVFMMRKEYEEGSVKLTHVYELLTGDTPKLTFTGSLSLNVPAIFKNKLLSCQAEMAWCYYKLKNFKVAAQFADQAATADDLKTQLRAIFVGYFIAQPKISTDDLEEIIDQHETLINVNLLTLKNLYGDLFFTILEDQAILKTNYLASTRKFEQLRSYISTISEEFENGYGIPMPVRFTRLYLETCKTCLNSLNNNLSREDFKLGLELANEYYEIANQIQKVHFEELYELDALMHNATLNFLENFYKKDNFKDLATLTLDTSKGNNSLQYLNRLKELLCSNHFKVQETEKVQYQQLAMQFHQYATELFRSESYELAHQYFQPAIVIFRQLDICKEWAQCCLYKGLSLKSLKEYRPAQHYLMEAVEVYEALDKPHHLEYTRIHLREVSIEVDKIVAELHKNYIPSTRITRPEPRRLGRPS